MDLRKPSQVKNYIDETGRTKLKTGMFYVGICRGEGGGGGEEATSSQLCEIRQKRKCGGLNIPILPSRT